MIIATSAACADATTLLSGAPVAHDTDRVGLIATIVRQRGDCAQWTCGTISLYDSGRIERDGEVFARTSASIQSTQSVQEALDAVRFDQLNLGLPGPTCGDNPTVTLNWYFVVVDGHDISFSDCNVPPTLRGLVNNLWAAVGLSK